MFAVHVEPARLTKNLSGSLFGAIWLEIDSIPYPENAWEDFPVVILGWWLEGLVRICVYGAAECEWRFMDGPFSVHVNASESGKWRLRFLRRGSKKTDCLFENAINSQSIIEQVLLASRSIIESCKAQSWVSDDLDILEAHYKALKSMPTSLQ